MSDIWYPKAERLLPFTTSALPHHVGGVVSSRSQKQVGRITAPGSIAFMQDPQVVRNRADAKLVGITMCQYRSTIHTYSSIATPIDRPNPQPTSAGARGFINLFPEAFFRIGNHPGSSSVTQNKACRLASKESLLSTSFDTDRGRQPAPTGTQLRGTRLGWQRLASYMPPDISDRATLYKSAVVGKCYRREFTTATHTVATWVRSFWYTLHVIASSIGDSRTRTVSAVPGLFVA